MHSSRAEMQAHRLDLTLYVITDRRLSGRSHEEVAEAAIRGGATVIQFREKDASTREMVEIASRLREITKRYGVPLIVNDRVDVALAVDADGVHVGTEDMPIAIAKRLIGPGKVVGASASTVEEALFAVEQGADYLGVGSIFATGTKVDAGPPIGIERLVEIASRVPIPVVAIGGIHHGNVAEVIRAGANGVAVISAVVAAEDIADSTRRLLEAIQAARAQ
ncbi:MAG: thiamine phosphate synthase [Armatimonadota bacterium]|nr:thiamine phosphate synthase [Armatimonadota bacterium]MDR5703611.1 thiamine phosphate synthase [Armatimonadota bacterium]MDR7435163.1 thiamine phosphate synthase [Armatimonadota bacterium]